MSLDWVARQIQAVRLQDETPIPQIVSFNPRPPGAPMEGSATDCVLKVLKDYPMRWFTSSELLVLVNRGRKTDQCFTRVAIAWGLLRLQTWKWVDSTPDESRNVRYLRYRLNPNHLKSVKE